ncbi:MAG: sulfurtransferase [Candidatus Heimdallarchaeota archaeon]
MNYPDHRLLVDPLWLAEHLDDENIVLIDCVFDSNAYTRAHIPGAIMRPGTPYIKSVDSNGKPELHLPPPQEFASLMNQMGVGNDTNVVCYDEWGSLWATRLWWALRVYGHTKTKILNGGWQGWVSRELPVSYKMGKPEKPEKPFHSRFREEFVVSLDTLVREHNSPNWKLIDVRSTDEYYGVRPETNKRLGHIPGALHLEWTKLAKNGGNKEAIREFRSPSELEEIFSSFGIARDKTIVTYCQSAIRATHTAFALELLGYPNVRVYDGSMKEWANLAHTPLI